MDELLRYAPLAISIAALVVALGRRRARAPSSAPARAHPTPAPLSSSNGPPPSAKVPDTPALRVRPSSASDEACRTILEERIGALESRLAALANAVDEASLPPSEDVAPMRPPVPVPFEPVSAPRSGWRMFP